MSRNSPWPDERLVKAAQDGNISSLTAVIVESQPHVRRFALSLCATPQDAEDAAQEALIILYRKIGTLRASGALASWMFRIVRNECLRHLRLLASASASASVAEEAGGEPAPSAETSVLRRLDAERIALAVSGLPRDQRQVLGLARRPDEEGATQNQQRATEVCGDAHRAPGGGRRRRYGAGP